MSAISAAPLPLRRPGRSMSRARHAQLRVLAPRAETPGLIARPALVERLAAVPPGSVTLLVAPAGYGKSTLLAEWSAVDHRPFAWVRPARADPNSLARSLEDASRAVCRDDGYVVVVEDAHKLRGQALQVLTDLIDELGPDGQVVLSARQRPGLQVARLRTERRLVEIGVAQLALTRAEVGALAEANGLTLDEAGCDLLASRTEGWPVSVYLAALALRDDPEPQQALAGFSGADRLLADYVRAEVLSTIPRRALAFVKHSAVLTRLSGPACDYVLDRDDSGRLLVELARSDLPLVPLDRTDTEYRYHSLLADALRSELKREDPETEAALHARASAWCERNGDTALAMEHALAAGDLDRAGSVLWRETPALIAYGRCDTLAARIDRFTEEQIASSPRLALSAASMELASGDRARAEHWMATAARNGGRPLDAGARAFRAGAAGTDLDELRKAAAAAYSATTDDSPWRSLACLLHGVALQMGGDRRAARGRLDEGARRGAAVAPVVQVLCLAQLALIALEEDDWDGADTLIARARIQTERVGLSDYPITALVFAVSAAVRAHLGQVEGCERDAHRADRLLPRLASFVPWYTVECRVALACASLRLGELPRARRLLDEAERDLALMPDATRAQAALDECRRQYDRIAATHEANGEALTSAELRVLQFLPTHLSFPEIADELYVSRNTVKTHVRAVYRKLRVTCRNEAVSRAREAGLLSATA